MTKYEEAYCGDVLQRVSTVPSPSPFSRSHYYQLFLIFPTFLFINAFTSSDTFP